MDKYYFVNEFSKILGIIAQTLRKCDDNDKNNKGSTTSK